MQRRPWDRHPCRMQTSTGSNKWLRVETWGMLSGRLGAGVGEAVGDGAGRSGFRVAAAGCAARAGAAGAQEVTGPGSVEDGRVPRMVEVEGARDLVDGAAVGDTVQVVGVVCTMDVGGGGGPPRDQPALLGSSITNLYVAVA